MGQTIRSKTTRDAVRRFPQLPARTIARYLIQTNGNLYENDLEKARSSVRRVLGRNGKRTREKCLSYQYQLGDRQVKIPETWRKKISPHRLKEGLWGVLSDVHIPFHEPEPLEIALQYFEAEKVDGLFLNGDIMDCAAVSYWPTAKRDWNAEVVLCIDFFDHLRQRFPKKPITYKPGNHELRLPKAFLNNLPDLAETPIAAMETTLGFEARDIEFLDYFQMVYAGKLPVLHGHELMNISRTVNPARGLFLRTKNYAACSHCHTTSEHTTRDINDNVITTWSIGCLCDLSPEYNPFGNDWNHGFALFNIEKSGAFEVDNRRIIHGKVK